MFYLQQDSGQVGPYTAKEIKQAVKSGKIAATDYVRVEEDGAWEIIAECGDLRKTKQNGENDAAPIVDTTQINFSDLAKMERRGTTAVVSDGSSGGTSSGDGVMVGPDGQPLTLLESRGFGTENKKGKSSLNLPSWINGFTLILFIVIVGSGFVIGYPLIMMKKQFDDDSGVTDGDTAKQEQTGKNIINLLQGGKKVLEGDKEGAKAKVNEIRARNNNAKK